MAKPATDFDKQVLALRGKVVPQWCHKKKADCTPAEWAANLEYAAALYAKSPQKMRDYATKKRNANVEQVRERDRARYKANADAVRARQAEYRRRNSKKRSEYFSSRLETNSSYRLICRLRGRLWQAIKKKARNGSAVRDLGCTIEELWVHLESKFQPGMTRENLGAEWVVDHIFPLSKANLQDKAEFLAANNWRNLQPLTPYENAVKKSSVTQDAQALFDSLVKEFSNHREQGAASDEARMD
jgi:hypothetical protein